MDKSTTSGAQSALTDLSSRSVPGQNGVASRIEFELENEHVKSTEGEASTHDKQDAHVASKHIDRIDNPMRFKRRID